MRNTKIIKTIAMYLALIIIWQLIYELNVDVIGAWKAYNFPSPIKVSKVFFALCADGILPVAIAVSIKRILVGYCISLVIGFFLGLILAHCKLIGETFNGLILGLQTLPSICWIPFAILWFGLDETAIIFVIAIGSIFAITMAIEGGIKTVKPIYLKAGKNMGARGLKLYINIMVPAALPSFISGMKQGWSFAWRGLMAGEMISASKGLGQVLMVGRELVDINQITVVMIIIIIIGLSVDKFIFGKIQGKIREKWGYSD